MSYQGKSHGSRKEVMNTAWISVVLGVLDEAHVETGNKEDTIHADTAQSQVDALEAVFGNTKKKK